MELNHYGDNVLGVVTTEDIVEGRFVLLTSSSETYDFGSREDLPGVKTPDTAAEGALAKYILAFAQDNRSTPIYHPDPSMSFALRYGFDQSANAPLTSTTVFLTHPGQQQGLTVYSGSVAVAFGPDTIVTLISGEYVYNASLTVPGAGLSIANDAEEDAATSGKPKYDTDGLVAEVIRFDSATDKLTLRIL